MLCGWRTSLKISLLFYTNIETTEISWKLRSLHLLNFITLRPQMVYVSQCVLEPPVPPADLFVPSPGYEVPPDLATVPPPFSMRGLRSFCPQRRFECSKWCCQHRDVKHVIFSCCNGVMNPYKRSRPDRDAVLWLPTTNWTVSRVCPTVCSPRTVPEVPTVFLVK